jgi:hypothetical protein
MEIVLVSAQVIGEPVDPLGEESYLNLRRTGIIRMRAKLGDDRLFLFALQGHTRRSLSEATRLQTQKNRARLSTQPEQYSIYAGDWSFVLFHRPGAETCRATSDQGNVVTC